MTGWICLAHPGPGCDRLVSPEVTAALAEARDVVGHIASLARVLPSAGLALLASKGPAHHDEAPRPDAGGAA